MAQAFVAVRNLRQRGHDVDENNDTRVQTYMALRGGAPPRRVTGVQLVERIRWLDAVQRLSTGQRLAGLRVDFWAVQRANFPDGTLPAICNNAVLSAVDYAGAPFSNDDFYFIDQMIDRSILGPGVRVCS